MWSAVIEQSRSKLSRTLEAYLRDEPIECHCCKRSVAVCPELDGYGRPDLDKPFRYSLHAGTIFGRPCPAGGELVP